MTGIDFPGELDARDGRQHRRYSGDVKWNDAWRRLMVSSTSPDGILRPVFVTAALPRSCPTVGASGDYRVLGNSGIPSPLPVPMVHLGGQPFHSMFWLRGRPLYP